MYNHLCSFLYEREQFCQEMEAMQRQYSTFAINMVTKALTRMQVHSFCEIKKFLCSDSLQEDFYRFFEILKSSRDCVITALGIEPTICTAL